MAYSEKKKMKILKPPGQKSACFKGQIGPRSKPIWEVLYGVIGAYWCTYISPPIYLHCKVYIFYIILSGYTKFSIFSFITSLSIVQCPFKQFSDHTFSAKPRDSHVVNCNHMNDHAVNSAAQCPSLSYIHLYPMYVYFVIDTL